MLGFAVPDLTWLNPSYYCGLLYDAVSFKPRCKFQIACNATLRR
jgi:hypothetical protein